MTTQCLSEATTKVERATNIEVKTAIEWAAIGVSTEAQQIIMIVVRPNLGIGARLGQPNMKQV